jgi:predicted aspartyl protease
MLPGYIDQNGTARVRLDVTGSKGSQSLIFEIDTGFFGTLLLPIEWTNLLTSGYEATPQAIFLADGTHREARVCNLDLQWIGGRCSVEVLGIQRPTVPDGHAKPTQPFALPNATDRRGGKPHGLMGRGLLSSTRLDINWLEGTVSISG